MPGKRRLNTCPTCGGAGTQPKQQQAKRRTADGKGWETYTETVQVDCPTCDGSGQVVDFDG